MEQNWIKSDILDDVLDARAYQIKFIENISKLKKCNLQLKKINQLCDSIYRGNTPAHIEGKIIDGALLLKTVNIRSNELDLGKVFSMESLVYENEKRFQLFENDICITIMGATEDIVGRSWVYNNHIGKACFSDGIAKIKNVNIDPYYLSTYINSEYGHLSVIQFSGSSTRSYVTNTQLGEILVPISSAQIQKYIGDKVRKAEELREEAKRLKKEAEELLLNWIGMDKENLDKEPDSKYVWVGGKHIYDRLDCQYYNTLYEEIEIKLMKNRCENLIDLCEDYSITVPYSTDFGVKSEENIYPMYRVKNIEGYFTDEEDLLYMNSNFYDNNEKCRVYTEDILLSRVGSIGRASIYLNSQNATMGQNVTRIRLKDDINKYYFLCYINSNISRLLMKRETNAGLQPNLTNENIKSLKVPILNKNIQDEIGNKILKYINMTSNSKQLIEEAKQDIENLIEGNFNI